MIDIHVINKKEITRNYVFENFIVIQMYETICNNCICALLLIRYNYTCTFLTQSRLEFQQYSQIVE